MKKIFAFLLVVLMLFSLTACSQLVNLLPGETTAPPQNPLLVAYVAASGDTLCSSIEDSFANASGMTCTASIEVVGNGLEITLRIHELDNVPVETIQELTNYFAASEDSMDAALEMMKLTIPGLESMKIHLCEKDGDPITSIDMV